MFAAAALLCVVTASPLAENWSWRRGDQPVVDGFVTLATDGWTTTESTGGLRRAMSDDVTLWLRSRLPDTLPEDAALSVPAVIGHFEVFIDGQRVYSFPSGAGVEGRGMNGLPWHLISLPPSAAGKPLAFRVRSTYPLAGLQGAPMVMSRAEFYETLVREDGPRFVIGCVLLALAVLTFFAGRGDDRRLALAVSIYALSGAGYVLFYTRLKQLLLPIPAPMWLFLYVLSLVTLPTAYFFFADALFETQSKWMQRFRRAHVWLGTGFVALSVLLWLMLSTTDSPSAAMPAGYLFFFGGSLVRLTMLVTSTVSTVFLIRWAMGRGAPADVPRARVLLAGIGVLLIATWLNVGVATGLISAGNFVPLGLLGLTASLIVLLQRSWRESRERAVISERALTVRAREKEAMLRDLHDGIGSVTTNIRMLAELGRRDEKRAVESLATIAELSSEGISELRTFIQSLDENQVDWPLLSAELRRFGGQLIESQGMQFQLDAELSDGAPPPTGAVTLALLRIFREALTNIVKHAGAKEVRARLIIAPTRLSLSVRDDGTGGGVSEGLNTGRGLRNMRARAEELGGQFAFERAEGTTVSIELPLAS